MATSFGLDINNPGGSPFSRGSVVTSPSYYSGYVEDIICNDSHERYKVDGSNIGEALIRILPDQWNTPIKELKPAYPLEMNIQDFPLVGEQVIVYFVFNTMYYSRKVSSRRRITENKSSLMELVFGQTDSQKNQDIDNLSREGLPAADYLTTGETNTDNIFRVNPVVKLLRADVGDIIYQGRFGNYIRMGSSRFNNKNDILPSPNILLTAGSWEAPVETSTTVPSVFSLVYENINKDKSSIWMVVNQTVDFTSATALKKSPADRSLAKKKTPIYDGAQIFINSDRVVLNSKNNETSIFSNSEINLSSIGAITLETENDILLRSFSSIKVKANDVISLNAGEVSITGTNNLTLSTKGNYGISGTKVYIGKYGDNTQPMVLGSELANWLNLLLKQLLSPGAFVGLTGPVQLNPLVSAILKEMSNNLVIPQNAKFNSTDNFVSKVNT